MNELGYIALQTHHVTIWLLQKEEKLVPEYSLKG